MRPRPPHADPAAPAGDLRRRIARAVADRYEIGEEIGRGGMAFVFRAHDRKHDRPVAVKVLRPEVATAPAEDDRFLREIRLIARLTHPHILPLHDSGVSHGLRYYVMPLVGESLRSRLEREGRLPVDEAVSLAVAVAEALSYAHGQDVLHRDIKPENILFNAGYPMVADFGIAKALGGSGDAITSGGIAVGTPAYMSPEQASAEDLLDGRSDLYSLACVLYEMLAGVPPFQAEAARKVMAMQVFEPAPPIRAARPDVPAPVAQALARALAKHPAERFATPAEFATALRSPTGQWPAPRRRVAVLPLVNASGDPANEYLSDGITDAIIDALARVDGLEVASRTSVFALKGSGKDVRAIGALLNVATVVEGTFRRAGDRLRIVVQLTDAGEGRLRWSQRFDRDAADVFAVEDDIAEAIVGGLRDTVAGAAGAGAAVPHRRGTANVAAYNLYLQGRFYWNRRTDADTLRAIEYFERAIAEDPEFALAYTGLADAYALQLDYRSIPVAQGLERATREAERAIALDEGLAEAHTSLAWVTFIHGWDWPGAEREFRRAIQLDARYATARQWYAWLLIAQGRFNEGLAEAHVAADLDPASVSIRRSLGWSYYYTRRFATAASHLERAIAMDPTSEETHRILAVSRVMQGDLAAAEAEALDALRLGEGNPPTLAALGYVLARLGRRPEAERLLADLEARAATQYISPVVTGTIHLGLGNVDGALAELERAYRERRGWVVYLNVDPLFDPLRADPRFDRLRRTMRLS